MALAFTIVNQDMRGGSKLCKIYGTIVASGSYSTGGDILNIPAGTLPVGVSFAPVTALPYNTDINGQSGFQYQYIPGTTLANGKVKVLTGAAAQAALTELSAGAYPAGVTGDPITIEIVIPR